MILSRFVILWETISWDNTGVVMLSWGHAVRSCDKEEENGGE